MWHLIKCVQQNPVACDWMPASSWVVWRGACVAKVLWQGNAVAAQAACREDHSRQVFRGPACAVPVASLVAAVQENQGYEGPNKEDEPRSQYLCTYGPQRHPDRRGGLLHNSQSDGSDWFPTMLGCWRCCEKLRSAVAPGAVGDDFNLKSGLLQDQNAVAPLVLGPTPMGPPHPWAPHQAAPCTLM